MTTIFGRHMAGRFAKPFAFGLGLFSILIFLGDTFDKMNPIMRSKAPLLVILECLWLGVPYWAVRVIPMATLLATLVAMSGFVQSGEWLASQACGFQTRRFWMPVLVCSGIVSVLAFAAQETVMPAAWARSRRLWRDAVHPEWEWTKYQNVALLGGVDQFIQARELLAKDGRLDRPIMDVMGPRGVERQLDARSATWDAARGLWVFHDGVERVFGETGTAEKAFKDKDSDLAVPPLELVPRAKNPDELTLREVLEQSRRGRFAGAARDYAVAAQAKVAYPFTNLIVCALGIPIALRLRRSSRVVSFCAALALSFSFLWTLEVGKTLGVTGALPPVAAAWFANVAFGALAAGLIYKWDL